MSLLSLLDRRFGASIRQSEISRLKIPAKHAAALYQKGVLSVGRPDEADSIVCSLGEHEGSDVIPASKGANGRLNGLCVEHGQTVTATVASSQWIDFNPMAWARTFRARNSLKGDLASFPRDVFRLGILKHGFRKVDIVVVAPTCPPAMLDQLRPNRGADLLLCICLGDDPQSEVETHGDRVKIGRDVIEDDMLTLNQPALMRALSAGVPSSPNGGSHPGFLKYVNGGKPKQLSPAEYEKESTSASRKQLALFVDVEKKVVLRDGKSVVHLRTKDEKGRRRSLSGHQLRMLAHYLKSPRVPLAPINTEAYENNNKGTSGLSAQQQFLVMRKSLSLTQVLKQGETDNGLRRYYFDPPSRFRYVLLTAIPTTPIQ